MKFNYLRERDSSVTGMLTLQPLLDAIVEFSGRTGLAFARG